MGNFVSKLFVYIYVSPLSPYFNALRNEFCNWSVCLSSSKWIEYWWWNKLYQISTESDSISITRKCLKSMPSCHILPSQSNTPVTARPRPPTSLSFYNHYPIFSVADSINWIFLTKYCNITICGKFEKNTHKLFQSLMNRYSAVLCLCWSSKNNLLTDLMRSRNITGELLLWYGLWFFSFMRHQAVRSHGIGYRGFALIPCDMTQWILCQ